MYKCLCDFLLLFTLRQNWHFVSLISTATQNFFMNGVIMKYHYLVGALWVTGWTVLSYKDPAALQTRVLLSWILFLHGPLSVSPSARFICLLFSCWLSGLIRRNCRTASSQDHPSGRHRGHKPVTQIIQRRTDLVPVNTSNPCFSLQLPKFVLSLPSIWSRFLRNINSEVISAVPSF
jgi:hypothetical protein